MWAILPAPQFTDRTISAGPIPSSTSQVTNQPPKVRDVDFAPGKLAKRLSTRSVRLARMILIQAIRNAMVNDLVVRNVAYLAAVPTGNLDGRLGHSTWSRL
jgi:hypothetical protein